MYYGDSFADLATMRLEGKIKRIYAQAYREIEEKLNTFLAKSVIKEKEYEAKVQAGKLSQEWFDRWKSGQVFIGKRWKDLKQNIAEEMYHTRKSATDMINGERKAVFQNNVNYTQYTIDKDFRFGISFDLYDTATVTRLINDDPDLVPDIKYPDPNIDYAWSKKQIAGAITQGILQGESIPDLAKRIGRKLESSNTASMVRCARTAMTGAQNSGRIEAMHNARDKGIGVEKLWIATLDNRTRDSHRSLDGQVRGVDEPFDSPLGLIMFPGDPDASPANTWNCRCTLGWEYPEYLNQYDTRAARDIDWEAGGQTEQVPYMTYREWENWKATGVLPVRPVLTPVVPPSIYDPDGYKPDKYDEEYKNLSTEIDRLRAEAGDEQAKLFSEKIKLDRENKDIQNIIGKLDDLSIYDRFKSREEYEAYKKALQKEIDKLNIEVYEGSKEFRAKRRAYDIMSPEYDRMSEEYYKQREILKEKIKELEKEWSKYQLIPSELEIVLKYGNSKDALQNVIDKNNLRIHEIDTEKVRVTDKFYEFVKKAQTGYEIERVADELRKVKWRTPERIAGPFNEPEVINRLAGGDLTKGSCASLALCYVGQKAGYDVIDYRDGKSREEFSRNTRKILESVKVNGGDVIKEQAKSSLTAAKQALKQMQEGKQYVLVCGHHASVVQKFGGGYQYLELQSAQDYGWQDLEKYGLDGTLRWRFDCKTRGKYDVGEAYLADVDELAKDERFLKILGYINTDPADQKKGSAGSVK